MESRSLENNTIKNLKLAILKLLCESFNLALPPGVDQRKKTSYIALLEDFIRCCACSAVKKANGKRLLQKIEFYMNVDIRRGPWSIFLIGGAIVVPA